MALLIGQLAEPFSSTKLDGVKGTQKPEAKRKSSMAPFMKDRSSNFDLTFETLFGVPPDLSLVR